MRYHRILAAADVASTNSTTTPTREKGSIFSNYWPILVPGVVLLIIVILFILSWLISKIKKAGLEVVYDYCSQNEFNLKYQVRVKVGKREKIDPKWSNPVVDSIPGSLVMDLIKPNGAFITRVKVPESSKKAKSITDQVAKKDVYVYKFMFATSKTEEKMDIGQIRLDWTKYNENIFVYYIEFKGVKRTSTTFRCYVNSKIATIPMFNKTELPFLTSEQTFRVSKNVKGNLDQSEPMEYDLTFQEFILFFFLAASLVCTCCKYFIIDINSCETFGQATINGAVSGAVILVTVVLLVVVFRVGIKKNLELRSCEIIRTVFVVTIALIAIGFLIWTSIDATTYGVQTAHFWAAACGIGVLWVIILGMPAILMLQCICQCVSPPPAEMNEQTTVTQSGIDHMVDVSGNGGKIGSSMAKPPPMKLKPISNTPLKVTGSKAKAKK